MLFVTANEIGIFALNREKRIVAYSLFPKDPEEVLRRLKDVKEGRRIKELEDVLTELMNLRVENIVTDIPFKDENFHIEFKKDLKVGAELRRNLRDIAVKVGFAKNHEEFTRFLSKVQILRTREKIRRSVKKDKVAIQAISALDELNDISNRFIERLREWYGLHYPELGKKVKDHEKYSKLVSEKGHRENFEDFKGSMGIDLDEPDIEAVKEHATVTYGIYLLRKRLSDYVEEVMNEVAPNTSYLIGPHLAARLLALAGSLEKLAKMPSSTIQLLGAEKALFRHMKGKGRPPKHGILYHHPSVINSPKDRRGKIARIIASKIAIATKTDFYTGEFRGKEYREDMEKKIKEVLGE
ncbi:MAG: C/D box methylation guide ribonucleoprotein complex aNOP56 subunit [Candidatus Aenigmatarchaeota archaeon]|nr:MAG: C/D box methylation guide ribonucleoprotein complex aNOP56 subunit [Candidatus Aenigmarchaeota archaeon]